MKESRNITNALFWDVEDLQVYNNLPFDENWLSKYPGDRYNYNTEENVD